MNDQNLLTADTSDDNLEVDANKNYFEELVGEGKKFKSPEDLAKGKAISDNYIKILESRLDAMREDYMKLRDENVAGSKLEDLMRQIREKEQQLASRTNTQEPNEVNRQPELDATKIESLVSQKVEQIQQSQRQLDNYNEVESKLSEVYGANYKTVLKEQAKSLGMTDEEVNAMARNNPRLFYKTFDVQPKQTQNFQAPPRSSQRNDNFAPTAPQKRTLAYYNDLRKKDPNSWLTKQIAVQMDKDAQELGASFFDA